jgi:hypothetical protein
MTAKNRLPDGSGTYGKIVTCSTTWKRGPQSPAPAETAEQELDRKVKTLMQTTQRSYSEAMSVVLNIDGELKSRWVAETLRGRK